MQAKVGNHWFRILAVVSLLLFRSEANAGSYCEAVTANNEPIVLSIPEEYYALPRFSDSMMSLKLRYRDLSAPEKLNEGYDPRELEDPDWSLERSNKTALLQVYHRRNIQWPNSVSDLQKRNSTGRVVASDWEGWVKFKECRSNCGSVSYVSAHWHSLGVSYVKCLENEGYDPLLQGCIAYDQIDGILVEYSFPARKKRAFRRIQESHTQDSE